MIEGQEGVSWDQWVALARACEEHGLTGLYRSDHYASWEGEGRGSLDAWTTLAALGAVTERIRLGTMVSPTSFRHPSILARAVVTADHVSGGRADLGIGAGWHEPEHTAFGFPFHATGERLSILEEQVEIVVRQWTEEAFDFEGEHYTLTDCRALPKPVQQPRPHLTVGGLGGPRSGRLAARWADEYNTVMGAPDELRRRWGVISEQCAALDRDPGTLSYSLMTNAILGRDRAEVDERVRTLMAWKGAGEDVDAFLGPWTEMWLVGTVEEVGERLDAFADAGIRRVYLQNLLHGDTDHVALMGQLA